MAFENPFQKQTDELIQAGQTQAVTQDFDESKGTAGRINDLTSASSPLMQAARTRAAQAANQRGLRNSSMAVQSGEQAVINTAMPIAQTDAQLHQQQALANQGEQGATNRFNANLKTTAGMEGLKAGIQEGQFGRSLAEQARQTDLDQATKQQELAQRESQFGRQLEQSGSQFSQDLSQRESQFGRTQQQQVLLAQMDADSRVALMETEARYKTEIAGNENISRAWGTMMESISQIQNNASLHAEAKKTLIANVSAGFGSFADFWKKVSGGAVDVSDLLNFGTTMEAAPAAPPAPTPPAPQPVFDGD